MLPIAGQTTGPIGLTFFVDTYWWLRSVIGVYKNPPLLKMYMLTFMLNYKVSVQFHCTNCPSAFYTLPFLRWYG